MFSTCWALSCVIFTAFQVFTMVHLSIIGSIILSKPVSDLLFSFTLRFDLDFDGCFVFFLMGFDGELEWDGRASLEIDNNVLNELFFFLEWNVGVSV